MSTAASGQYWEPRIGQEATQTLKSAYQYIRYFFILWPIVIAIFVAATFSRTMPLWFSIVIAVAVASWISVAL